MSRVPTSPDRHDHPQHFADEDLPDGSVVSGSGLKRDVNDEFDFVVVGSGAAGAVAAHTLAAAGWSVAIVEEGPWRKTRDFNDDVRGTFRKTLRDHGTQVLKGRVYMPMLQGRCVGGSTVVNSAIAWRLPEDVVDEWRTGHGTGDLISMKSLEPHFEALERDLNVHAVLDEVLGQNNRRFIETAKGARRPRHAHAPLRAGLQRVGPVRDRLPLGRKARDERELRPLGARHRARADLHLVSRRARRASGRAGGRGRRAGR